MQRSPCAAARALGLALGICLAAEPSRAQQASATATLHAEVRSRSVLRVSSPLVQFVVSDPTQGPARAVIEFEAAARTRTGADVVLTLEPIGPVAGPYGAADLDLRLAYEGRGDGVGSGMLDPRRAQVVARWTGSGKRRGHLVFLLDGVGAPGVYTFPVRFVLTAP